MTTADHFGPARPRTRRSNGAVLDLLARAIDVVRRWRRMHKALGELRALDDRLLEDIGLSRSTLYASARERHGLAGSGPRRFEEMQPRLDPAGGLWRMRQADARNRLSIGHLLPARIDVLPQPDEKTVEVFLSRSSPVQPLDSPV